MAYIITDACISCGTCTESCPMDVITPGDDKYEIDPDACIGCGACVAQCPVEAIVAG